MDLSKPESPEVFIIHSSHTKQQEVKDGLQTHPISIWYVIECGYDGRHPHIHATLSLPPDRDYESLRRIILKQANKLHSIGRQIDIQPYKDFGWFEYSLKTGIKNLVVEDIQKAHHLG